MKKFVLFTSLLMFLSGVCYGQQTYDVVGALVVNPESNIAQYEVFRGPSGGPYPSPVATVIDLVTPSFSEIGLSGPNCWVYKAVNTFGFESILSEEACVDIPSQPGAMSVTVTITFP